MTKRRIKNPGPVGHNKSLGNCLVNKIAVKQAAAAQAREKELNPNILEPEPPKKVLGSITNETNLEEFMTTAELANRNFEAEKSSDFRIISTKESSIVATEDLKGQSFAELNKKYGSLLRIPRRPKPGTYNTAEELTALENEMFLEWRRSLSVLTEGNGVVVTPFERNLELWRQLWRVIERSDILVQIVDARNPLLFRNADLEKYVKEVDRKKENLLLLNKCDLLTAKQLLEWQKYFQREGIRAIFWTALEGTSEEADDIIRNPEELLNFVKTVVCKDNVDREHCVIGMVGYPNVGKSSTINRILGAKKTSVSATPGKTKHFQTLQIDNEITLCDCPGLVVPSFGFSTSEMLLNAILPIDTMKDGYTPIQLLCNRIPRSQFESTYSILLPKPADHEPSDRPPTAHELLTSLAFMRGFMTSSAGVPDCSRAARLILKDVVNGKLKWIAAPPGIPQEEFNDWAGDSEEKLDRFKEAGNNMIRQLERRNLLQGPRAVGAKVDNNFFERTQTGAHIKGGAGTAAQPDGDKRHGNKNKREKLRRVFGYLDA
ncbi:50S ribosome-binding GTPase domain-containing protein [Ditylenchus destructor]|nr:50S ribosome-binding GTPase domain-containing protein [Ditylenchus destructor]